MPRRWRVRQRRETEWPGDGGGAELPQGRPPRPVQRTQVLAHQRAHALQGSSAHIQETW
jgi:hypothetical protein